ncbi:hypothetical protein [Demequina gelatinilytica]|uniref:hypothetical protein n=1 Tax=Demequina gelatinilytica TaxID=1638980 RepID=UPI0012E09FD5|nr:hypothetical protein [Demequina gelatinilytica]
MTDGVTVAVDRNADDGSRLPIKQGPRAPRAQSDLPRWAGATAWLVAAAVLVAVQWRSVAPVFRADEVGNLGNAYLFAHPDATWMLAANSYMPGTSMLLTPVWWVTSDPEVAYRIAVIIVALVGLLTILPLRAIAREVGAPPRVATVLAAIVVVAPSRALESNYVWGENLLVLCVAVAVLLLLRLDIASPGRTPVYLGAVAGTTFLAHGRALPFALAVLVVGAVLLRGRLKDAAAVVASGVAVLGVAYGLHRYIGSTIYLEDERVGKTLNDIAHVDVASYLGLAAGQLWYTVAAWAGLTVIGGAALLARARRESWRGPAAAVSVVLVAMSAAVPLLLANGETVNGRAHVFIYGRYLDAFLIPLAVIGLVMLWRGVPRVLPWVVVVLGAIGGLGAAWMLQAEVPAESGDWIVAPAHVAGVAHLMRIDATDAWPASWWAVTMLGLVPALVVALLARWRVACIAAVAIGAIGLTLYSDTVKFDRFEQQYRVAPLQVEALAGVDTDIVLYGDIASPQVLANGNEFTYWATPRAFVYMDTARDTSGVELFIANLDSEFAAEHGASPLVGTIIGNSATWVMPGELHDELDSQGRVLHRRED